MRTERENRTEQNVRNRTERENLDGWSRWSAVEMLQIWARGQLDHQEHPFSEVRRLSHLTVGQAGDDLVIAAVTRYVEETPGLELAYPALSHCYVHGLDWSFWRFRDRDSAYVQQPLLQALIALGWEAYIDLAEEEIAPAVETMFRERLQARLLSDPPRGDLATVFAAIAAMRFLEGPVTEDEKRQAKILQSIRRAQADGRIGRVRTLIAKLEVLRGVVFRKRKEGPPDTLLSIVLSIRQAQVAGDHAEAVRLFERLANLALGPSKNLASAPAIIAKSEDELGSNKFESVVQ